MRWLSYNSLPPTSTLTYRRAQIEMQSIREAGSQSSNLERTPPFRSFELRSKTPRGASRP